MQPSDKDELVHKLIGFGPLMFKDERGEQRTCINGEKNNTKSNSFTDGGHERRPYWICYFMCHAAVTVKRDER